MWLPVDSQRPTHLGAPRPHPDPSPSVSPRQSVGDLGGDRKRPAAALRALHPFLSGEQHHPCGGRVIPACRAPPDFAAPSSSSGTAAAFTRGPTFVACSPGVHGCTSSVSPAMPP